nr:sigma 54-interacting transcriptional regulator [uncultured Roseateles sp.]
MGLIDYRLIKLVDSPKDSVCAFLVQGQPVGSGGDELVFRLSVGSGQPIRDLVDWAQKLEWERACLDRQERDNLRYANDPSKIPVVQIASLSDHELRKHDLSEGLRADAKRIRDRGTAIAFAGQFIKGGLKQLPASYAQLLSDFGKELESDLDWLAPGRITFLPLCEAGQDSKTMMAFHQQCLIELQGQLTSYRPQNLQLGHRILQEGPILLVGDTGSGKSEMARALHQALMKASPDRKNGKFVSLNVAALTPDLLEARLRGYMRGAYTGADREQPGCFETANNGVLFLDEFQSASMEMQLQLLDLMRAVSDTVEVARMGEEGERREFRVRLILAVNEPVQDLIQSGRLRRDVLYRIRRHIETRPLSARLKSEPPLLDRLWALSKWRSNASWEIDKKRVPRSYRSDGDERLLQEAFAPELPNEAKLLLHEHGWPGNLREFERVCFDVLDDCDSNAGFSAQQWPEALRLAMGNDFSGSGTGKGFGDAGPAAAPMDAKSLSRLNQAEAILKRHKFNMRAAAPDLKAQQLPASHKGIKEFLRRHSPFLRLPEWKDCARASKMLV